MTRQKDSTSRWTWLAVTGVWRKRYTKFSL